MITLEEKEKNFSIFVSRCAKYFDANDKELFEKRADIRDASWDLKDDIGLAYPGSLLEVVLKTLIPTALKINDSLPEEVKCDTNSIIRVLLMQHIGKAEMFVPNPNEWERTKLKKLYTYNENLPGIKLGGLSYLNIVELKQTLSRDEYEAITIIDRKEDDWQAKLHVSVLSNVVRVANDLTNVILKKRYESKSNKQQ